MDNFSEEDYVNGNIDLFMINNIHENRGDFLFELMKLENFRFKNQLDVIVFKYFKMYYVHDVFEMENSVILDFIKLLPKYEKEISLIINMNFDEEIVHFFTNVFNYMYENTIDDKINKYYIMKSILYSNNSNTFVYLIPCLFQFRMD